MQWIDEVDIEQRKQAAEQIQVTELDIERAFEKIKGKTSKSPGPNMLNYYIIRMCWQADKEYFLGLVQKEVNSFDSPLEWSKVNMRPIYKGKGDKQDPNSYRLITLADCFYKFIEGVVLVKFRDDFEREFGRNQFGFSTGVGTHTCIERMHNQQHQRYFGHNVG